MPRNLDVTMAAELATGMVCPCYLAELTFASGLQRVWTGTWPITWNGKTFSGVGELAGVGAIAESSEVRANGTSVSLLTEPALLQSAMADVQVGLPAKIWWGFLSSSGAIVGAPFLAFSGMIDEPSITEDPGGNRIVLALESRLRNLQRANQRRYTAADQKLNYPNDSGFNNVEYLNEISLRWGS